MGTGSFQNLEHPRAEPQPEKVVVAMSGGVDSAAAAVMLHEEGYQIIGISMQVWDYRKNGGSAKRATCCAPADFDDAREVAFIKNFPYYVYDFEESFHKAVIEPFIDSYMQGYTPNPCLNCNRHVKFQELRRRAAQLGARHVATGHYAQIRQDAHGTYRLFTGADEGNDQSYFLYAMTQHDLATTLFPVGGMKKSAVRAFLEERGLWIAAKEESQDICFVADSVGSFIERERGALPGGRIVSREGQVVGEHDGIHRYTVGQRRGLGVSSEHPLYVLNINPNENTVTVGSREQLERDQFSVRDINWISGRVPDSPVVANVKLRYRHPGVLCEITPRGENEALVRFCSDWTAVSPGQAAVFYAPDIGEDDSVEVIGGGIIMREEERLDASV